MYLLETMFFNHFSITSVFSLLIESIHVNRVNFVWETDLYHHIHYFFFVFRRHREEEPLGAMEEGVNYLAIP